MHGRVSTRWRRKETCYSNVYSWHQHSCLGNWSRSKKVVVAEEDSLYRPILDPRTWCIVSTYIGGAEGELWRQCLVCVRECNSVNVHLNGSTTPKRPLSVICECILDGVYCWDTYRPRLTRVRGVAFTAQTSCSNLVLSIFAHTITAYYTRRSFVSLLTILGVLHLYDFLSCVRACVRTCVHWYHSGYAVLVYRACTHVHTSLLLTQLTVWEAHTVYWIHEALDRDSLKNWNLCQFPLERIVCSWCGTKLLPPLTTCSFSLYS